MSLPNPQTGLVIGYSYLWAREHSRGQEEGLKSRPCVIVLARRIVEDRQIMTVVPITHSPPQRLEDAVELPAALKHHLGLDELRSWVIVSETNDFLWPGPDLRPIPGRTPRQFDYGMLPPRFFTHLRDRLLDCHRRRTLKPVPRTE